MQSTQLERRTDRAIGPLVGTVAMIAVTVCLATVVVGLLGSWATVTDAPTADFQLSAESDDNRLVLTHVGGDSLEVDSVSLVVFVEASPLEHQPPIPFFAAHGFNSDPTGPINSGWGSDWSVGDTGTFGVASTNSASIDGGDHVRVTVVVNGNVVATLETNAV